MATAPINYDLPKRINDRELFGEANPVEGEIPKTGVCGHWLWYNKVTGESSTFFCNSPKCCYKDCQEAWARRRINMIQELVEKYYLSVFFTLTIERPKDKSAIDLEDRKRAWEQIPYWWSKMRKRLSRYAKDLGTNFEFVAIIEAHKADDYPHIHGFWNIYIDCDILSQMWSECAPGKIVKLRTVDSPEKAAKYLGEVKDGTYRVAKYVGKEEAIRGAQLVGENRHSMWRTKGLKTEEELRKCLTPECECDMKEWMLLKHPPNDIVVYDDKELENAKAQFFGEDLEAACSPVSSGSFEESVKNLEAEKYEAFYAENQEIAATETKDQRNDKKREEQVEIWQLSEELLDHWNGYQRERILPPQVRMKLG